MADAIRQEGLSEGRLAPTGSRPGRGALLSGGFEITGAGVIRCPEFTLEEEMDRNQVEEFLACHQYSDSTKDSYRRIFGRIFPDRELRTLTAAQLLEIIKAQKWGNSMQCLAVAACRKFLRWQFGIDHPALGARIKVIGTKPQRTLTPEKALELLMWFDASNPKGARDLAMAALLLDTGLRVSEVCRLQLADMDLDRRYLQVLIKGGKWSEAVYSDQTAQYLSGWLAVRCPALGVGALFVNIRTGGQLTREGLQCVMRAWGAAIGIKLSPHDFRRSYATIASLFGAPSRLVQIGGRWATLEMVERYTRALQLDAIRPYLPVQKLTA